MTMTRRDHPVSYAARKGSVAFAVSGDWFGYWFTPGVPMAMS